MKNKYYEIHNCTDGKSIHREFLDGGQTIEPIKCPSGHKQDRDGRCKCTNKDGK